MIWTEEKIKSFKVAATVCLLAFELPNYLNDEYGIKPAPEDERVIPFKKFWQDILDELNKTEPNFALIETWLAAKNHELANNPSPN